MRIKDQISLRKIADEYIMIVGSEDSLDYTQAVSLNDSAAYLIEQVRDEDFTQEDWVDLADIELLVQMLKEANVID